MTKKAHQEFTWVLGGPQGSGVNSSAEVYGRIMTRLGYYLFSNIEHHSNIKGKHSHFVARISNNRVRSHRDAIDMLVVLDEESLQGDFYQYYPTHRGLIHRVKPGGRVLFDTDSIKDAATHASKDVHLLGIPFTDIIDTALTHFGKAGEGRKFSIMKNTVALGASLGLLNADKELMKKTIAEGFKAKKKAAETNAAVAECAYNYVQDAFKDHITPLFTSPNLKDQIMINGSQSAGMAKISAGCGLLAYYPISPATAECEYLEQHQEQYPMQIVQCEDEVASINIIASGAHAGVRSTTSTSGPGFALMAEGIGYAAITEAPGPVVSLYQRSGPSTGVPTRQEQGDLRMAIHNGQGDYPVIVLAPGDTKEYFYDTFEAFNLCDRYQVPAIMMFDKHGARSMMNLTPFDDSKLEIDRGSRFDKSQLTAENPIYNRYQFGDNPVSPRSIPGEEGGIFWTSSDEHHQDGHISEGVGNRMAMMHKRMAKMDLLLKEFPRDEQIKVYGNPESKFAVVTWGTTKSVLQDILESEEKPFDFKLIQIKLMNPFPKDLLNEMLSSEDTIVCCEQNWDGQLAGLLQQNMNYPIHSKILKFDGRPLAFEEAIIGLKAAYENPQERIVISDGEIRNEETWGYEEVANLVETRKNRNKQLKTPVPLPPGYNR